MIFISHRGNITGKNPHLENSPGYIMNAVDHGFDVEIDVRWIGNNFYLGHDDPQHLIHKEFLTHPNLWCHAKNIDALEALIDLGAHCFWHETDTVTLTSLSYLWTFPAKPLTSRSICVLPESWQLPDCKIECAGICSDIIATYKDQYDSLREAQVCVRVGSEDGVD